MQSIRFSPPQPKVVKARRFRVAAAKAAQHDEVGLVADEVGARAVRCCLLALSDLSRI